MQEKTEEKRAATAFGPVDEDAPMIFWVSVFAAVLSGVLLALSFPGFSYPMLAFIALVPLMLTVRKTSLRRAAGFGFVAGAAFFAVSLFWLCNLTHGVEGVGMKLSAWLGFVILAFYCALYFIPPTLAVYLGFRQRKADVWYCNLLLMLFVTATWVAAEYLRGWLFTGFPWNPLGVSQYQNLPLIQVAAWGGVYAVSACIIWMNTAIFITVDQYIRGLRSKKYRSHIELMLGLLPMALCFSIGLHLRINTPVASVQTPPICVVLVQPNIAQPEKWDEAQDEIICETLDQLSFLFSKVNNVDLVIWPETAIPYVVVSGMPADGVLRRVADSGVPLLVGALAWRDGIYYNSSILYDAQGGFVAQYDKQHLVPFGEYVPFPRLMSKFTPVELDLGPGRESTLFHLPGREPFSVLICFEDSVASLTRKAVRAGAGWLVNQTNDAWFDPSAQSEQHLAHAVFRCVENQTPMVRCCNTGVTCAIDADGYVRHRLAPRTEGGVTALVQPRNGTAPLTFYTRRGDCFAYACITLASVFFGVTWFRGRDGRL